MTQRIVPIREFIQRSSLSRASIYRMVKSGELPAPIRLSAARVGFPESVVEAWFEKKLGAT